MKNLWIVVVGALIFYSCSSGGKKNTGAENEVGIVGPGGQILFYSKDGNDIVVRNYDLNQGLVFTSKETCEKCSDTDRKIAITDFKSYVRNAVSLDRAIQAYKIGNLNDRRLSAIRDDVSHIIEQIKDLKKFYGQPNVVLPRPEEVMQALKDNKMQADAIVRINKQVDSVVEAISSPDKLAKHTHSMQSNDFMYALLKNFAPVPRQPCGEVGTPLERANDCAKATTSKNTWELVALTKGMKLITRTKELKEVWRDTKTGLIWGDRLEKPYSFNDLVELDKNQRVLREKICPTVEAENGKLVKVLRFRLPTIEEFKQANSDGIRTRLPNMDGRYWTSSVFTNGSWYGWVFDGSTGESDGEVRDDEFAVRCVAETPKD